MTLGWQKTIVFCDKIVFDLDSQGLDSILTYYAVVSTKLVKML